MSDYSVEAVEKSGVSILDLYDPVPNLATRPLLVDRLGQALVASSRNGAAGAIMVIDFGGFKLPDAYSETGSIFLKSVVQRLTAALRNGDTIARINDNQLAILLEGLGQNTVEAAAFSRRIANKIFSIFDSPFTINGHERAVTCGAGVAMFFGQEKSEISISLLEQADLALRQSKKEGANTLCIFSEEMQEIADARQEIEAELLGALARGEFALYYQVQVDKKKSTIGFEALIRWFHPVKGLIYPVEFIPIAEESGLIVQIEKWVVGEVCRQLESWKNHSLYSQARVSVNISARHFKHHTFSEDIIRILDLYKIDRRKLTFEITENILIDDIETVIHKMDLLRSHGIEFSLDDFGTGYCSLLYLKKLPLKQLKIDKCFVRDLASDNKDVLIAKTIIYLAKSLGLTVVAEGVETEKQFEILQKGGCVEYQGYLFGKPAPITEMTLATGISDSVLKL
jgi:diguanylate cyclase (GGDEF)-like protein